MNVSITPARGAAEQGFIANFEANLVALARREQGLGVPIGAREIAAARRAALDAFVALGLPHRRVEAWKYTDLRAHLKAVPPMSPWRTEARAAAAAALADPLAIADGGAHLFSGGHYLGHAGDWTTGEAAKGNRVSRPAAGIEIEMINRDVANTPAHPLFKRLVNSRVAPGQDVAVLLNRAFAYAGMVIRVAPGVVMEAPIRLSFREADLSPLAISNHVLIVVGEGASVTVVESHTGRADIGHVVNSLVEFDVAAGAKVAHVRLNAMDAAATSLSTLALDLSAGTQFDSFSLTTGASLSRHQVFARFSGAEARLGLAGATMLRGRQHADTTLVVDHVEPGGVSRETFKTVLEDNATGVFQGRINVAPRAQKTDGRMASHALLLGDGATMNNKPELEIFADDVQCAHGATCGALDDDLLFYLMARGIPRREAEGLMIRSFVGEAIDTVANASLREALGGLADGWLERRGWATL